MSYEPNHALVWPSSRVKIVEDAGSLYLDIADRTDRCSIMLDKDIASRIIDALHGYLQDQAMETNNG